MGCTFFYFIFVQFMQFPVLHFGLAHSGSRPFNCDVPNSPETAGEGAGSPVSVSRARAEEVPLRDQTGSTDWEQQVISTVAVAVNNPLGARDFKVTIFECGH